MNPTHDSGDMEFLMSMWIRQLCDRHIQLPLDKPDMVGITNLSGLLKKIGSQRHFLVQSADLVA